MTIRLELTRVKGAARIKLSGWDGPDTATRCKGVSGSRAAFKYEGNKEMFDFWHYPVDMTVCILLRSEFPDLVIGPALTRWAKLERRRRVAINDFHVAMSAEPVDLPVVRSSCPTMWDAMSNRGYQTVPPAFAKVVGNYFNASQPGCGKTIETFASLVECEVGRDILVVAPRKAIRATWGRETGKWLLPDMAIGLHTVDDQLGDTAEREAYLDAQVALMRSKVGPAVRFNFVIINPEMLRWKFTCADEACDGKRRTCQRKSTHEKFPLYPSLFKMKWDCIILDETHKMMMNANEKSANVSGWGYGAQKLVTKSASGLTKIGLSGTPFKGKPRRFWPVLHWLNKDKYPGEGKWTAQYFEMDEDFWAASGQKATDRMRKDRVKAFNDDLSQLMVRHTKRELHRLNPSWAPPEPVHCDIVIPIDPKQGRAYAGMVKSASARLETGQLDAVGILAEMTRLKQLASAYGVKVKRSVVDKDGSVTGTPGKSYDVEDFRPSLPSCKWDWIVEALEERGLDRGMNDGSVKIIIASQYVSLLEVMKAALDKKGVKSFMITGATKDTEAIQDAWQSGQTETRVLFLSTMAGGVSLTLDAADDVIMVDETFVPDDQEQVWGRAHRTSRTDHQVTVYWLRTEGTIDEVLAENNLQADYVQKGILDGRRGVEFARLVLAA